MKKLKIIFSFIILIIIALGLYYFWLNSQLLKNQEEVQANQADDPKNLSYIINDQVVSLLDGQAITETAEGISLTTKIWAETPTGDLNDDDQTDTAIILTQSSGADTYFYLAAALKTDQGYSGTNAILLGDRIVPHKADITDGILSIYYNQEAAEDVLAEQAGGLSKKLEYRTGQLWEINNY